MQIRYIFELLFILSLRGFIFETLAFYLSHLEIAHKKRAHSAIRLTRGTSKPTQRQTTRMRPQSGHTSCSRPLRLKIASFLVRPLYTIFQFRFSSSLRFHFPFGLMNFRFNIVLRKRKVKPETAIAHEVVLSSRGLPVPNQSLRRF